jgi:HK97 family phage portal protein
VKMNFSLTLGKAQQKDLTPVPLYKRGWRVITEAFAGAWQNNIEEKHGSLLCYPTIYACLSRISQDIGKMPFQLMEEDSNGIWKKVQNPAYSPVLRKPNNYQLAHQFREYWVLSRLIEGNTYVLKGRDDRRVVNRLYILDPCRVQPLIADNGDVYYEINYPSQNNLLPDSYPSERLVIPASEIIHDRLNTFHHQLIGVPPVCAAYWPALKNLKILKTSAEYFANGAQPGGILTAPAGMSDEDAAAVKSYWDNNFTGENRGKVGVIGADMKFTPFAYKSSDSQLVEQMKYSDIQICQAFGMPPFKVGIDTIPAGMTVDDLNLLYAGDALQPQMEAMEWLLDEGLGVSPPLSIELDMAPLLRMDVGKQAEVETKLVSGKIKSSNEGRRPFNLPALPGGDTIYMQQQDYPMDQVRLNKIDQTPDVPDPDPNPEELAEAEELRQLRSQMFTIKAIEAARIEAFP